MFYITNTEKDTWEVRLTVNAQYRHFAQIIRWGDSWEVREMILPDAVELRRLVRSAIWDWIESETKTRGEAQRPVYLYEETRRQHEQQKRPEPLCPHCGEVGPFESGLCGKGHEQQNKRPEPRQQQKEGMPVWML